MREIPLTKSRTALVDDEDYERISAYNWAFRPQSPGYAVRKGRAKSGEPRTVHMHREILNVASGVQVDHINGDGLDNRKANLRIVDVQRNAFNRKKPNVVCTSKYKGVYKRRGKPSWYARIKYNDRQVELGACPTEEQAAAAYNFASDLLFGEYRRGNDDPAIPLLTVEQKAKVFSRCKRKADACGWVISTPAYRFGLQTFDDPI